MTDGEGVSNDGSNLDPKGDGMRDPAESQADDQPLDAVGVESEGTAGKLGGDAAADQDEGGIVDELTWFGRGFFQPLYSLQFYRSATKKSLIDTI